MCIYTAGHQPNNTARHHRAQAYVSASGSEPGFLKGRGLFYALWTLVQCERVKLDLLGPILPNEGGGRVSSDPWLWACACITMLFMTQHSSLVLCCKS